MKDDWNALARDIGFIDEKEMLERFYLDPPEGEGRSIAYIAGLLGIGTCTVQRHLTHHNICKRGRGGANNIANQRAKLFHMDQRIVLLADIKEVMKLSGVSKATIYHYRTLTGGGKSAVLRDKPNSGPGPVLEFEQLPSHSTANKG